MPEPVFADGELQAKLVVRRGLDRDAQHHVPALCELDRVVDKIDQDCRSRMGSPTKWSGTFAGMSAVSSSPF